VVKGLTKRSSNNLLLDGLDVRRLAQEFGTPLFVFFEGKIIENAQTVLNSLRLLGPKHRVFYACKANSNLAILKTIRQAGLDLEVNSGGELFKGLRAGFKPEQIIFNGVGKTETELIKAISVGLHCINIDSFSELDSIIAIAKDLRQEVSVALRLIPEIKDGGHQGLETGHSQGKFGFHPTQLEEACQKIKEAQPWVQLKGLHAHVGSQLVSPYSYQAALKRLLDLKREIENRFDFSLEHLNLGGGIPVNYLREELEYPHGCKGPSANFAQNFKASDLAKVLKGMLPEGLSLYMEPGRSIVGDTAFLLTQIIRKKFIRPGSAPWLIIDAGFNILLEALSYQWYFHLIAAERPEAPHDTGYFIGGPLCDGGDIFPIPGSDCPYYHRLLPRDMEEGDLLAFLDTGAYTLEQMTYYNGRLPAAAVMVTQEGEIRLIRRRETYEDLIAQDVL